MGLESEAEMYHWIRYDNETSKEEPARIYNKSGMILEGEEMVIARIGWLSTIEGAVEMRNDEAIIRDRNDKGAIWILGAECLQH